MKTNPRYVTTASLRSVKESPIEKLEVSKPEDEFLVESGDLIRPGEEFYIEADVVKNKNVVICKVAAWKDKPAVEISWCDPRYSAEMENFILSGVNIKENDAYTGESYNPTIGGWNYIKNLHRAFLGPKLTATKARKLKL